MRIANARRLFLAATLVLGIYPSLADNNPILSVADGMPKVVEVLGQESFVEVEVEKLKDAKVWFVDYEWHRKHGIEVPADGMANEEFKKQILDAYAWQARGSEDHNGQYTGEKKKWYADYYGGYGMGTNHGSGRAAAMGLVQAKGTKTSLAKSTDPWHSNGAVQTIEAADEAIWSHILDAEMTHGSNKVVAVIQTGTYGRMKDGNQVFPRALIIREMAVRPAHFQLNYWRMNPTADSARVAKTMETFLSSLPKPAGYKATSPSEDLRVGINELIDREAKAQAEYFAKRMFFGSVSPSNLEITGRRLDLGDHTAQEGYTKIYRVDFAKEHPFGTNSAQKFIFEDMRKSWAQTLPPHLRAGLPTQSQMIARMDETFEREKKVELVKLAGAPDHLVEQLQKAVGQSKIKALLSLNSNPVSKLGSLLVKMTEAGNRETVFTDPNGWENKGVYNINKMLVELAAAGDSKEKLAQIISKHMLSSGPVDGAEVLKAYTGFKKAVAAAAAKDGVSSQALNTYMKITAQAKNKTLNNLFRGHRRWRELWDTTDKGISEDPKIVEKYIEDQVDKSVSRFKDAAPYHAVIRHQSNRAAGKTLREVFDAKTGKVATVLKVSSVGGKVQEFYYEGLRGAELKDFENKAGKVIQLERLQKKSAGGEACRVIFKAG